MQPQLYLAESRDFQVLPRQQALSSEPPNKILGAERSIYTPQLQFSNT